MLDNFPDDYRVVTGWHWQDWHPFYETLLNTTLTAENIDVRGSSRYFARVAADAAKKWKFAPGDNASPREWLIEFDFAREGVSAHAAQKLRQ